MANEIKLYSKAINEAMSLQKATLKILRNKRGKEFFIKDTEPYLLAVEGMKAADNQEETVFSLEKDSVKIHYDLLTELTKTLETKDEAYTEHFQTPGILEILYEEDPDFKTFTKKFIDFIPKARDIILKEGERKYNGFYGPTASLDFALTPGATSNVLNQILKQMEESRGSKFSEKERYYAKTILASKSWGMNTPYGFGWKYLDNVSSGKSKEEAVSEEIKMLQFIFSEPLRANEVIMEEVGFSSFDSSEYLKEYKKRIRHVVKDAVSKEVHYGNILGLPALSVGDIGHHLCQSLYDVCEDSLSFRFLEAMTDVMELSMRRGLEEYENMGQVLSVATGSIAASIVSILKSEGFTGEMTIRLLFNRFKNIVKKYPNRGIAVELHNVDFMDAILRGEKILKDGDGKVSNIPIDFTPLRNNGILRDFTGSYYPNYGMTSRFAVLMKFSDHFCLLNGEPASIGLLTNIISLNPKEPIAPILSCKHCASSFVMSERCDYCGRKKAI